MRTKTLLLTAALAAAGVASSMAQVYSINAVGYINVSVPPGYSIIANQLNASPDNTVQSVLGAPPSATVIYTYRTATSDFSINGYDVDFASWDDPSQVLAPGTGIFIFNGGSSAYNVTFVGEVPQGSLSQPLANGYNLVASKVPQAGLIATTLGYPVSTTGGGDVVYRYNNASSSYLSYTYDPDFGWDEEPNMNVGEGAFIFRGGAAANWTRTFNVN